MRALAITGAILVAGCSSAVNAPPPDDAGADSALAAYPRCSSKSLVFLSPSGSGYVQCECISAPSASLLFACRAEVAGGAVRLESECYSPVEVTEEPSDTTVRCTGAGAVCGRIVCGRGVQ